jgi:multicomponent Na+:H+ antiporter subunit B
MPSLILRTATRLLLPLLLLFSVFLLLRGHNAPGGGFVGGLVAATGYVLFALASGLGAARAALRVEPQRLAAVGLLIALASGTAAWVAGRPFMTGLWWTAMLPVIGKAGTPLLFDCGVYLLVAGITLTMVFPLLED